MKQPALLSRKEAILWFSIFSASSLAMSLIFLLAGIGRDQIWTSILNNQFLFHTIAWLQFIPDRWIDRHSTDTPILRKILYKLLVGTVGILLSILILYGYASLVASVLHLTPPGPGPFFVQTGLTAFLVSLIFHSVTLVFERQKRIHRALLEKIGSIESGKETKEFRQLPDREEDPEERKRILVRTPEGWIPVALAEIDYISSHGKRTVIHTASEEYITGRRIKEFESSLPPQVFVRIHKSYIANIHRISSLRYHQGGSYLLTLNDAENSVLPVSRSFASPLKRRLGDASGSPLSSPTHST